MTRVGLPGDLGRARVVFALPMDPVEIVRRELVVDYFATLTADATDVTIGMDRIYVHRMLYATTTHDTRRLA